MKLSRVSDTTTLRVILLSFALIPASSSASPEKAIHYYLGCDSAEADADIETSILGLSNFANEQGIRLICDWGSQKCGYLFVFGRTSKAVPSAMTDVDLMMMSKQFFKLEERSHTSSSVNAADVSTKDDLTLDAMIYIAEARKAFIAELKNEGIPFRQDADGRVWYSIHDWERVSRIDNEVLAEYLQPGMSAEDPRYTELFLKQLTSHHIGYRMQRQNGKPFIVWSTNDDAAVQKIVNAVDQQMLQEFQNQRQ